MARPKADEANKRSFKVTVRFNQAEWQQIRQAARDCGMSVYLVVRHKLLKGRFPKPKTARIDIDTYTELKKQGINLNQLTRLANAGKFRVDVRDILLELRRQQYTIISILLNDSKPEDR